MHPPPINALVTALTEITAMPDPGLFISVEQPRTQGILPSKSAKMTLASGRSVPQGDRVNRPVK